MCSTSRANLLTIPGGTLLACLLDLLCHDLAHARQLVARENVEHLEGEFLQLLRFAFRQAWDQAADLAGEIHAHFFIDVAGENLVGLARRRRVARHLAAHFGGLVLGEEVKDFRSRIFAAGEIGTLIIIPATRQVFFLVIGDRRFFLALHPAEQSIQHDQPAFLTC